jgi:Putative zinc-finger
MKRNSLMGPPDPHRECWELLPWLANESITGREAARLEEHVSECAECRRELELQRKLRSAMRAEEAVVIAPQTSLQKLIQRIEAEDIDAAAAPQGDLRELSKLATPSAPAAPHWPRWFTMAAVVQGIVIAGLLASLWLLSHQTLREPRFTTLSSPAFVAQGPVLRVVFAEHTSVDEINDMLRSIDAQIVAGPSEAGVYTLAVQADPAQPDRLGRALTRLRADPKVVFSESAVARPESP